MAKSKVAFQSGIMTTPIFRLSFPSFVTPSKMPDSPGEPKFGCTMLFKPAEMTPEDRVRFDKIKSAVKANFDHCFDNYLDDEGRFLEGYINPLRRGESKMDRDGYGRGVIFMAARNSTKPNLVDVRKKPIDVSKFYAGAYCRASVSTWDFDNKSKGVGFNLHNMMWIGDGEPFGNTAVAPESDFGDLSAEEMSFDDPMANEPDKTDPFGF